MGEIAEAMLNGELCQMCGVYMGDSCGHPRTCGDCLTDQRALPPFEKVRCEKCGKLVKSAGLSDHIKAVHSAQGGGK